MYMNDNYIKLIEHSLNIAPMINRANELLSNETYMQLIDIQSKVNELYPYTK